MPEEFDLDALELEDENADPFRFTFRGEKYEMPLMMQMDFSDQLALEDATLSDSLEIILGTEQFKRLLSEPVSTARMKALIERWQEFQGLEPGKSESSRRSSARMGGRSKRTSRSKRK